MKDDDFQQLRDNSNFLTLSSHSRVRPLHGLLWRYSLSGEHQHVDRVLDDYELLFVKSGYLGIQEEDRNYLLRPGEAIILFPGRRHKGILRFPKGLSLYYLHFSLEEAEAALGEDYSCAQYCRVARPDKLSLYLNMLLEDQSTPVWNSLDSAALARLALGEIARSAGVNEKVECVRAPVALANRAHEWIQHNYGDGITTKDVAAAMGCHANYLSKVFREQYDTTILQTIHQCQLHAARKYLLAGELSLEEIAQRCGFADTAYLRRLFKREYGMTPHTFRNGHTIAAFARLGARVG